MPSRVRLPIKLKRAGSPHYCTGRPRNTLALRNLFDQRRQPPPNDFALLSFCEWKSAIVAARGSRSHCIARGDPEYSVYPRVDGNISRKLNGKNVLASDLIGSIQYCPPLNSLAPIRGSSAKFDEAPLREEDWKAVYCIDAQAPEAIHDDGFSRGASSCMQK